MEESGVCQSRGRQESRIQSRESRVQSPVLGFVSLALHHLVSSSATGAVQVLPDKMARRVVLPVTTAPSTTGRSLYVTALILILIYHAKACVALNASTTSPWSSTSWKITVDFGREQGTAMPGGESGARLVLPIAVSVEADAIPPKLRDDAIGRGAMVIRPMENAEFINTAGRQTARLKMGGWKIELPQGAKGLASKLGFYLDLENELSRNDVTVRPGRLYFFGPCWREDEWIRGQNALAPFVVAAEEAQARLDEQISHETGDRRLDGDDPIETLAGYKDMALLVADREESRRRRREAETKYPKNAKSMTLGNWPGTTEPLAIGRGNVLGKVKEGLFGEKLTVLGRWEATPILLSPSKDETVK